MIDERARVHLRRDLLANGFTDDELRQRRRSGSLQVLRPGAYLARSDTGLDPVDRHALLVLAEVPRPAPTVVVSHGSAAVLHGLPVPRSSLRRVHVTRNRGTADGREAPSTSTRLRWTGGMSSTSRVWRSPPSPAR